MKVTTKTMLVLASSLMLLSACETMEGLGRDTSKLGNNVTNSAEKHDLDNNPNQ